MNNQRKTNFTNLANTYTYGSVNSKTNFYKYYRNDVNSIDDPIFTGFTFDIDILHSPLFFTGTGDNYTTLDSLKGNDSTSLAKSIENRLEYVYKTGILGSINSYEINTMSSKDYIDDNTFKAGYGLQDKVYMDSILYGATDYIYMVDSNKGSNSYDNFGIEDLGNGTPNKSFYDAFNKNIGENEAIIEDCENVTEEIINNSNKENIQAKIKEVEKEKENYQELHNTYKDAYETSKQEYEDKLNEYNRVKEKRDEMINSKNEFEMSFKQYMCELYDLAEKGTKELGELYTAADEKYKVLIAKIENKSDVYKEKIKEVFNKFKEFTSSHFNNNQSQTNESDSSSLLDEITTSVKDIYKKGRDEALAEVKKIYNNFSEEIEEYNKLNEEYLNLEKELYGEGKSFENCDETSFCGQYKMAADMYNNDEYSTYNQQINSLQETINNYDDTLQFNRYRLTKNPDTGLKVSMSSDVQTELKTGHHEVPQTVYDMLGFIEGMKKLTMEYPYVMQTVSGLDEAYKKYFVLKDPYMGSGDDKITISCYESLDLRVSSMFNKYLNAAYDRQYRRERVPINLRRFNCSIFVHDIRNFRHSLSNMDNKFIEKSMGDDVKSKIVEIALNYASAIEFKFYDCEIVPEETGNIFDSISNESAGDMKRTNFTFTYGNCVINFLPFADLNTYYTPNTILDDKDNFQEVESSSMENVHSGLLDDVDDSNFRRWFDRSELGNVRNNDYREYIRHDSSVAVDDYYKTTIVNNFALNSVANKNRELTHLDDSLRRIVTGISASTGIPVKGVTDALNVKFIDPIINKEDRDVAVVKKIGNANNSKVIDEKTMEYIGKVIDDKQPQSNIVKDLGKI